MSSQIKNVILKEWYKRSAKDDADDMEKQIEEWKEELKKLEELEQDYEPHGTGKNVRLMKHVDYLGEKYGIRWSPFCAYIPRAFKSVMETRDKKKQIEEDKG